MKQKYTQSAGRRPFGISCLLTGFDYDGTPHLYQTDPAGTYTEWKANAIGRSAKTVRRNNYLFTLKFQIYSLKYGNWTSTRFGSKLGRNRRVFLVIFLRTKSVRRPRP